MYIVQEMYYLRDKVYYYSRSVNCKNLSYRFAESIQETKTVTIELFEEEILIINIYVENTL